MFGRVAPEDKLRLAKLMQESGDVVAMTGDAVNDAAALKQADIGVAMGSGSEVSKQAAKIVLTDDNFATLVRAVDLGRDIYRRITSYVKLQLTILSSVLQLMLLATIFNINDGVALFPMQLLFCKFFVVVTVVIGFIVDVPDPGVMQRPAAQARHPDRQPAPDHPVAAQRPGGRRHRAARPRPRTGQAKHHARVGVDDDGVRRRRVHRREPRLRDAARARGALVLAAVSLHGLDHPRLVSRPGPASSSTCCSACSTPSRSPARQWAIVLGLSLIAPALVWADKAIQLRRQKQAAVQTGGLVRGGAERDSRLSDCRHRGPKSPM